MIRHAFRTIGRMPGLAAVVILSLGVGIGVNTAVFSWIQAILLKPIPGVDEQRQLLSRRAEVRHRHLSRACRGRSTAISNRDCSRSRSWSPSGWRRSTSARQGAPSGPTRSSCPEISSARFGCGRRRDGSSRQDEVERPGAEPVVVISHDYWQTHFAGSPSAIGQTIRVNDLALTIVGVAPERLPGHDPRAAIRPVGAGHAGAGAVRRIERARRSQSARLLGDGPPARRRGRSAAHRRVRDGDARAGRVIPESNGRISGELMPYWRAPRGPQMMFITALGILQGVMLLVLLAVCGNTANLVLARASARHREVGVRLALGAGPGSVIRLMLAENLLLGICRRRSSASLIAWWGTEALRSMPPYGAFPVRFQTSLDALGLAFAVVLGIGSGLLFGAAPALAARTRRSAAGAAQRIEVAGPQRHPRRPDGAAVRPRAARAGRRGSLLRKLRRDARHRSRVPGRGTAARDLRPERHGHDRRVSRAVCDATARSPAARAVGESVALANSMPLDIHGLPLRGFTLEGRAQTTAQQEAGAQQHRLARLLQDHGHPDRRRRGFCRHADHDAPPQVIVNEEFVRRYIAPADPLGRRLHERRSDYTIAGVVKNSTYDAFGEPPTPAFFFSYRDRPRWLGEIHLRARPGSETLLASEVQRAVREIDASLPVYNIRTMAEHVERNLFLRKIPARMFVVIAPLLLALVAIGIYAVVSYTVSQRTTEIGVRIAMGATGDRVVRQIVKEGLIVTSAGLILAWVIAAMVEMHLFSGGPGAWTVLIAVPLLLFFVALLVLAACKKGHAGGSSRGPQARIDVLVISRSGDLVISNHEITKSPNHEDRHLARMLRVVLEERLLVSSSFSVGCTGPWRR